MFIACILRYIKALLRFKPYHILDLNVHYIASGVSWVTVVNSYFFYSAVKSSIAFKRFRFFKLWKCQRLIGLFMLDVGVMDSNKIFRDSV
jgi:hypothetical protein